MLIARKEKAEVIAALKDILLAEQQRIATPELPVEIIAELIGDRVKESVRFALL